MLVPVRYRHRHVYHITHIDNLLAILNQGLLSIREMQERFIGHTSIAHETIQETRDQMRVTCEPGGTIHDYVPFYFCKRSPMLRGVVRSGYAPQHQIIYLEVSITILEKRRCVFTDASANASSPPRFYSEPRDLDLLDWDAIETWKWGRQYDQPDQLPVSRRKQAELLVHQRVDPSFIQQVTVWDDEIADRVCLDFRAAGLAVPSIHFGHQQYYFEHAPPPDESEFYFDPRDWEIKPDSPRTVPKNRSMQPEPSPKSIPLQTERKPVPHRNVIRPTVLPNSVTQQIGQLRPSAEYQAVVDAPNASLNDRPPPVYDPEAIARTYRATVDMILQRMGRATEPQFPKLKDLRDALMAHLSCLSKTRSLMNIVVVDSSGKQEFAGTHARKVAHALLSLSEYAQMDLGKWKTDQLLCLLAAFLQDIGYVTQPTGSGLLTYLSPDPSHSHKALPLIARILINEVGTFKKRSACVLPKLVCYHDLLEGIVSKRRSIEELEQIAEDPRELDMLIALGTADMLARDPTWRERHATEIAAIRHRVMGKFTGQDETEPDSGAV